MSSRKTKAPSKLALTRKRNAARRRAMDRKTPHGRLDIDGATISEKVRRRLQWLAQVWQIPAQDLPKVTTQGLMDFAAEKYDDISFDWLLCGDLKGLQRMLHWRKNRALPFWRTETHEPPPPAAS